jgi:predicted nucleic acid-binding protein
MSSGILMDTGPLVAYLSERELHHRWAVEQFETLDLPFVTCEAVLTEACFITARNRVPPERVLETVARGVVHIRLRIDEELAAIRALMQRYENVPMSLADACLVRLAEMTGLPICTLDRDFTIYRTSRRRALTLIVPNDPRSLHEP